jgi:hypothetical protein
MSLINEIEELLEFFESNSNGSTTTSAGFDALKNKLKKIGGAEPTAEDEPEENDENSKGATKLIDTETDEEEEPEEEVPPPAPINMTTKKVAKQVKLADISEVAEFYSNLVSLKNKIEALDKLDGADVAKIKVKASKAYDAALEKLEGMADDTFPKKLESFGVATQKRLIESLSSVEQVDKNTWKRYA